MRTVATMPGPGPLYQFHDYWTYPDRYSLVSGWWAWHGMPGVFAEMALPRMAVIVERDGKPVAMLACDMSNSIGKATLESGITAPGLTAAEAREALRNAEKALLTALKDNELQYGMAQTFTSPAIARTLERDGWRRLGEVVHLVKQLA